MTVVVRSRPVGRSGGEPVEEFVLDNGRVAVAVWTYGATLVEVRVPGVADGPVNVIARLPTLRDYERHTDRAYVGSTLGRFGRLIAGGSLVLDGVRYRLTTNAGRHHIHGGTRGFDAHVWQARTEPGAVELSRLSPDGEQGYPGNLVCTARFELDRHDRLTVTYRATTDHVTACGLTSHPLWNLAGAGPVDEHVLQVNSRGYLSSGAEHLPDGRVLPTAGTELDLATPRRLGSLRIDNCFALDDGWAARLTHPASGRALTIRTDQPGLAVYTGDLYAEPRRGICLQTTAWPDAPNQPGFPPAILRPGQTYWHRSTFELSYPEGGTSR